MTSQTTDIVRESLAKLLSNENIKITHSATVTTSAFDVINRELILPVWKDVDQSAYTLLITHEVGHALYSPSEELMDILSEQPKLKHIINIVEDVRIEKLIQKKYPGTKFHFRKGYLNLLKENFFGTKDRTPDSYELLDRLNIHFKVGTFDYYSVPFSEDELVWIDKISSCDTFSDVCSVSKELLRFLDEQKSQDDNNENDDSNSQESPKSEEESSDYNSSQSESDIDSSESEDGMDSQTSNSNSNDGVRQESEVNSSEFSAGAETNDLNDEYYSETQSSFDSSVTNNIVDGKIQHYIEIEDFSENAFDKFVVDYRDIHNLIDAYYENLRNNTYYTKDFSKDAFITKVSEFKAKHSFSVNSMANLFEMKKRATLYSRSLTSKTGQLDMNRIHSYSYSDDIFKKITSIPEGKSHGIVMFFDMSSSMDRTLSSCLEQILLVAMFCKKINIPFDVYGFSNNQYQYASLSRMTVLGDIKIDEDFTLRHYLSSRMTSHEYENAFLNIIRLSEGYDYGAVPPSERLCSTPLVPCILASKSIIKRFRSNNSLDIVNALFITDGDDNHYVYDKNEIIENNIHKDNIKCVIRTKAGREYLVFDSFCSFKRHTSENLLKMVKSETGANMISFYLDANIENACRKLRISMEKYSKDSLKKNGFLEVKSHVGYDALYVIKTSRLKLETEHSYADNDYSADDIKTVKKNVRAIARNFNKYMNKSTHNKIFLNKFMEQIS